MLKTILKLLAGSVLLIATQACAPRGTAEPTLDPNSIHTAVAQTATVAAALTQVAALPIIPNTGQESPPPQ